MHNKIHILVVLIISLVSCDETHVFDEYQTTSNGWKIDQPATFTMTPPDTLNTYNLFINLRSTNSFPYSNLFLITKMQFPHGKVITDTLEYRMAFPNGEWMGEGFSDVKENKLWYKEGIIFSEDGEYTLEIFQAMRENGTVEGDEILAGITEVGFRIEKPKTR
ncbi:gliding motility lipoprotein GldH [Gangjinia marincola]|uniref:Gliding motility lipoprotein GldH n=1 Tax=Gangjinia marincola TaxID=578463 RepID=A0ABP3XX02_9FLAO